MFSIYDATDLKVTVRDNGSLFVDVVAINRFKSKVFQEFITTKGDEHGWISPYHVITHVNPTYQQAGKKWKMLDYGGDSDYLNFDYSVNSTKFSTLV